MIVVRRWLPSASISIVLIAALSYFIDFGATLSAIRKADSRLLAAAMPLSFIGMFVRAKVWQTLLRDRPIYRDVLLSTGVGYLLNNLLPFRLGELGRVLLLSRKSGMQVGVIIPSIVIERIVDVAFCAALLFAALPALPFVADIEGSERIGYVVGASVAFGLVTLCVLARNNQRALDLFHKLSARRPSMQKIGGRLIEAFLMGLDVFTSGWLFTRFVLWMTLDWAIALVAYLLIIGAFFSNAELSWGLLALGAATFGGAIPSLPGGVGTFEGAIVGVLTLLTHDQSTSLAAALTMRFYNYLNSGVIGGIGLLREGQTLSGIYQQLIAYKNKTDTSC